MAKIKSSNNQSMTSAKPQAAAGSGVFVIGMVLLLVSIAASLILVLRHLAGMKLPGCGLGSGCERAAASVWGKVPGLNIPTSSIGLAFFTSIAIGWIVARGAPESAFRWLVRLGALISAGLLAIIAVEQYICIYCLAAHAGNLAFWLLMEVSGRNVAATPSRATRAFAAACIAFVVAAIALGGIEFANKKAIAEREKAEHEASVKKIIEHSTQPVATAPAAKPFTGRYRQGLENAAIRIVIISDYQCLDCKAIEQQVKQLLASRSDISVSAKHHPMCPDCNKYMGGQKMHDNACWAARAAETAGILRGNDGFWQMHHWLFDRGGAFTDQNFPIGLREMGYDPQQFISVMSSNQPLDLVKADIEEAQGLGLHFTPLIFINGVELRGFRTPGALINAVQRVAAANPQPGTAAQDQPVTAADKYVGDWREMMTLNLPPDTHVRPLGPIDAKVLVVMYGDYSFGMMPEAEGMVRAAIKGRNDVQFHFRHFPIDKSCNKEAEKTSFTTDCLAAKAAEASGIVGGNDGFWKMHDWLLKNASTLNEKSLRDGAVGLGFDADALMAALTSPEVQAAIDEDAVAFKQSHRALSHLGFPQNIPMLYINNRFVPRWKLEGQPILERIIEEAAK